MSNALVFDIETIADLTPENRDAVTALATGRERTPESYGALCPPLARVVCIAWLDLAAQQLGTCCDASLCTDALPPSIPVAEGSAAGGIVECRISGCSSEAAVLQHFGGLVEQHLQQPEAQLVTYNGRGFDLPVLVHRSIKHAVAAGRELFVKALHEGRSRPLLHLDLMDVVTFFGASGRWPLAAYVIGYGFPSPKSEMDGEAVGPAVQAGRLIDVARYCAADVIATAHLYRRLREQNLLGRE